MRGSVGSVTPHSLQVEAGGSVASREMQSTQRREREQRKTVMRVVTQAMPGWLSGFSVRPPLRS